MDHNLACNYRKCRKSLDSDRAWVTSCSHIFCNDDGENILVKNKTCPACSQSLQGKLDIVRIDVNPSESYKTMILAGQRPEVIMDACSRAISFWTYQTHQNHLFQDHLMTKVKERQDSIKRHADQIAMTLQSENRAVKTQLNNAKKEIEKTKKMYLEAGDKLRDKTRQYQKLLSMYNNLKRTSLYNPSNSEKRKRRFFGNENSGTCNAAGLQDALSMFDLPFGGSYHQSGATSPVGKPQGTSPQLFEFRFSEPNTPFVLPQNAFMTQEDVNPGKN